MYLNTKMNFLGQGFQKLEHEQDRQTDRHRETDRQTRLNALAQQHSRVVNTCMNIRYKNDSSDIRKTTYF